MNYVMAIWNTAQQALVYAIRGQGIRIVVDELAYLVAQNKHLASEKR